MRWRRMKTMKKTSMDAYCAIQSLFVPVSLRRLALLSASVRHDPTPLFVSLQTEKKGAGANGVSASRAEQSRAEQSRAEQSRAEQSRAEHLILSSEKHFPQAAASTFPASIPHETSFLTPPAPIFPAPGGFFVLIFPILNSN